MHNWKPLVGHEDAYEVSAEGSVRRSISKGKCHQRLTPEQRQEILHLSQQGQSQRQIARKFGVTQMVISKFVRGVSYVDQGGVLSPALRRDGYLFVTLSENGRRTHKAVHTAVAEAFIGPRPPNAWVNHKDGDKLNNQAENLEYMSPAGNSKHAQYELGKVKKLTFDQAKDIWYAKQRNEKRKDVAAKHNVSVHMVTAIWMGKSWWHAR